MLVILQKMLYFIKHRENDGHANRSVSEIVRETFDLADGARKERWYGKRHIGGLVLMRDETN